MLGIVGWKEKKLFLSVCVDDSIISDKFAQLNSNITVETFALRTELIRWIGNSDPWSFSLMIMGTISIGLIIE